MKFVSLSSPPSHLDPNWQESSPKLSQNEQFSDPNILLQFGICSRVGSFLRCRRRAQTSTRSSLSSSEAQSNKVPILARSKPISKHGGGGAKKSQLPSLAIQKKKPTGSRKKTKVVKESQIGECAVEKQDSVEQMQMKMAKLMKQFNDLKMS